MSEDEEDDKHEAAAGAHEGQLGSFLLPFAWPMQRQTMCKPLQFVCTHALAQSEEIRKGLRCSAMGYTWHRQELRVGRTM